MKFESLCKAKLEELAAKGPALTEEQVRLSKDLESLSGLGFREA